jgi:thiamine-phosphate pyrophosphorylase
MMTRHSSMTHGERVRRFDKADLYVVITEAFCGGRTALEVLDAVLDAGVRLVQCREKDLDDEQLFDRAREFRYRTDEAGAVLIIDDRLDIALAVGADGVHLGQDDLPVENARPLAPEHLIGASTHSLREAQIAQREGASYLNIGPIFATQTKATRVKPLGPDAISQIAPKLTVPFSCMGGIKAENIDEVVSRGARHPAVVTAVTAASDVRAAATALRERIAAAQKHEHTPKLNPA